MILMLDSNKHWQAIDNDTEERFIRDIKYTRPITHTYCPLFCPCCNIVVGSIEDVSAIKKYSVCEICYESYYFTNKEKWNNGWRPSLKNKANT